MKKQKQDNIRVAPPTPTPQKELKEREREFIKEVGKLIGEMREEQGKGYMNQEVLAKLLGMSRSNLNHIENGKQSISVFQLWLAAHYLNCDIEMLFPKNPETQYPLTKGERRTLDSKDKKLVKWVEEFKY